MNKNKDKSKKFSDNHKPGFNPPPYIKHNNNFPTNKKFNKSGTKSYVPAPNANNPVASRGSNATSL